MRFIGSKIALLNNIENVINENTTGKESSFCDIFSGTGAVAKHFKSKYEIYSNDLLYFSYIIQKATVENNNKPLFKKLKLIGIIDPIRYLEEFNIESKENQLERNFIYKNYSPNDYSNRMYISNENALRIDFIRRTIEAWKRESLINELEYYYLLASLIEGVPFISNITGTYGAYLKKWDKRALKKFEMSRLEVVNNKRKNKSYNMDANELIKELEGDILYIDPPYNSRQYAPNYHLLETISKYDYPEIYGVTGMRPYKDVKSDFCSKDKVLEVFDDLIEKAKFTNIIMSYSTDGLMTSNQIEEILKKHGDSKTYKKYSIPYRKYKSKKDSEMHILEEYIFYIKKNIDKKKYFNISNKKIKVGKIATQRKKYIKSPLNYIGGKYKLLPQILPLFPKNIDTFVDLFCGGCNVAVNIDAQKIICNDINSKIIELYDFFMKNKIEKVIKEIEKNIKKFDLSKQNEEGFKKFREYYNKSKKPIDLYTLACYSFNYQIRFNNALEYNNPFGKNRSHFSENMKENLYNFVEVMHNLNIKFSNISFENFDLKKLSKKDIVYCDPPYFITTGSYNDGNRGFKDWKEEQEKILYTFLDKVNENGIKFALSNVIEHKGKSNKILKQWSKKYKIIELDFNYSNSSYNSKRGDSREVLIINY